MWSLESRNRAGLSLDLLFVEDDPGGQAAALREAVPHTAEVVVDAPYLLIDLMRYPWAAAIRDSDLPKTVS